MRTVQPGRHRTGRGIRTHYAGSVSTLSELVLAQGRSSQADVDWLHMLVGDLQLLADLAFADIVLWVPSGDDDFVAVAHARPSSAATLFYRDFVGQQIKSQWRDLVTQAFETARIVDSSAPDWYEEMPTRVRAVPVMRRLSATGTELAAEPVAVITRHTNLGATRTPSRQELTFNECAEVGVPGDDGDGLGGELGARRREAAHHGHGADARRHLLVPVGRGGVDDGRRLERLRDEVAPLRLDRLAHEVPVEERRRARRPRVRDRHEVVVARRHPQHDVGEGEVGEQLQVADEHVQPVDVGLTAAALGEDEFTEGRHRPSVVRGPRASCRVTALSRRRRDGPERTRIRAASRVRGRARCGPARTRAARCAADCGAPSRAGCAR